MDYRKIAVILLAISIGATIGQMFNYLTVRQMLIINVTSAFAMFILVISSFFRLRKMMKLGLPTPILLENTVKIPKAHIENKLIYANADLLNKSITPTNPFRNCVFRINMELSNTVHFNISAIRLIESKIIEDTVKLKSDKGGLYIIDTIVGPTESVNFKFNRDIYIKKLSIEELYSLR